MSSTTSSALSRRFALTACAALIGIGTAVAFVYRRRLLKCRSEEQRKNLIRLWVRGLDSGVKSHQTASASRITLISNLADWCAIESEFQANVSTHPTMGFDCEWVSPGLKNVHSLGKVSLIQLALYNGWCVLIRLHKFKELPPELSRILCSSDILKLGVGIQEDVQKLRDDYGLGVTGFVDLRHVALKQRPHLHKTGLAGLTTAYVGIALDKDWRIRAGNWEAETLTERQVLYAANDALAGINVAMAMTAEALKRGHFVPPNLECHSQSMFVYDMFKEFRELPFKFKSKVSKTRNTDTNTNQSLTSNNYDQEKAQRKMKKRSYRKGPLYHNAQLEAPDGQPLCVCDVKKANWYILKNLGTKVCDDPLTVRLNFEPTGRPEGVAGEYYLTFKENVCVVCGAEESYLRKYIVPHEYRKYFPDVMRDHQSHDILLMCYECHRVSNLHDLTLRRALAKECSAPIGTEDDVKVTEDADLREVKSAARALLNQKLKKNYGIPKERIKVLEQVLKDYYGLGQEDKVTDDLVEKGFNLVSRIQNSSYLPHGSKVVEHFKSNGEGLIALEKRWRIHFLDTMKPKFLPALWSVNHQQERLDVRASEFRIDKEEYKMAIGSS